MWVEFLGAAAVVTGTTALILTTAVAIIMPIAWHTAHVTCLRLHEQTGYPTRMAGNAWSGECYINPGTRYIPAEQYINADVNKPPQ